MPPHEADAVLFEAAATDNVQLLGQGLPRSPGAIAARRGRGLTMLHVAAQRGATNAVRLLLECGLPVDSRDDYGFTPLHYAAKDSSHAQTLCALVTGGADVDAETADGFRPIDLSCLHNSMENTKFLVRCGADTSGLKRSSLTALRRCLLSDEISRQSHENGR